VKARTTNPELLKVITFLKRKSNETGSAIWRDIAERLGRPKHRRCAVNVSRINRYSRPGEMVVVPGKVLGSGQMDHPVYVAAFSFSREAVKRITEAKGECLSIPELVSKNPKGSNVRIIA